MSTDATAPSANCVPEIAIARESVVFATPLPGSDACAAAQASTQIHAPITFAFKFILILLVVGLERFATRSRQIALQHHG
jgi:hypothetical protein